MIDTHCHLTYPGLVERLNAVLAEAHGAGVTGMLTIGTSLADSRQAATLARERAEANVWAAVGVHPHHAGEHRDRAQVLATLRELAVQPRVVALGEMGLDQHYPDPPLTMQRELFGWQLDVARETGKAVVIHNREATDQTLALLRDSGIGADKCVFHCFTGTPGELEAILDFGAYVGLTGIVTFRNARSLGELIGRIPLDRLLLETDAPYLTPEPYRKVKVNAPRYVVEVAKFVALKRGLAVEELMRITDANVGKWLRVSC